MALISIEQPLHHSKGHCDELNIIFLGDTMKNWIPPCMDSKRITCFPRCMPVPGEDNKNKCSVFIAVGCHGFYPSSDEAQNNKSLDSDPEK